MEKTSHNILKKIEDLKKEIKILKEENAKTKRNLMWKVRKLEKDKLITEDQSKKGQDEVQKITDATVAKVDDLVKEKEAELLKI